MNYFIHEAWIIHGIPEHHRPMIAPIIFAAKFGQVDSTKSFFTDGSLIEELAGFGIFNEIYIANRKFKAPCSEYVAELAAIHFTLEIVASLTLHFHGQSPFYRGYSLLEAGKALFVFSHENTGASNCFIFALFYHHLCMGPISLFNSGQ